MIKYPSLITEAPRFWSSPEHPSSDQTARLQKSPRGENTDEHHGGRFDEHQNQPRCVKLSQN